MGWDGPLITPTRSPVPCPLLFQVQYDFAMEKNKPEVARLFYILKTSRPLWSLLL